MDIMYKRKEIHIHISGRKLSGCRCSNSLKEERIVKTLLQLVVLLKILYIIIYLFAILGY